MSTILQVQQVQCINKTDRFNAHERLRNIGGIDAGVRWKRTQPEAISDIDSVSRSYFVSVAGKSVSVIVATSRFGLKYLKTEADGEQPNNLLSLPECP
jgi:hypothetical protein